MRWLSYWIDHWCHRRVFKYPLVNNEFCSTRVGFLAILTCRREAKTVFSFMKDSNTQRKGEKNVLKSLSSVEYSIHTIIKSKKEIHASFAVKAMPTVCDECSVNWEEAKIMRFGSF